MIIAHIVGGLGNQMFQYAAARRASLVADCAFGVDLSSMATYRTHSYGLDQFALTDRAQTLHEVRTTRRTSGVLGWVDRLRGRVPDVREKAFTFDPAILGVRSPARLVGYWQSEKYFSDCADVIRAEFALSRPMAEERRRVAERIAAVNSVSVHVRRGNYVTDPGAAAVHGTCSMEWYSHAIEAAAEGMDAPTFFVFSDDPAWVKENLPLDANRAVYLEPLPDGRDAEDMHLMAACRAHVIANSTFSWWGAWLDPRADKRVVAPARWFRTDEHDTRDLVPEGWLRP